MQAKLYAPNYPERREEIFVRSGGQCENILADGERCTVKLGDLRITRSHQLQFEELLIHHPNGDPENPDADMLAVCWACHMRLHRKPGPGRPKADARKRGYEVIRIPYLMSLLAKSAGLSTWPTPTGGVGWRIDALTGEAAGPLDALLMALHWMRGELRDLQEALARTKAENRRLTDRLIRMQQAQERRECDAALRGRKR